MPVAEQKFSVPFRQVRLEFHNPASVTGIGADFASEQFASTLSRAYVEAVTCFAKDRYGWLYYSSAQFPERVHPGLARRDLLTDQVRACQGVGIRVFAYVSANRDEAVAHANPGWRIRYRPNGDARTEDTFPRLLCMNSPYRHYFLDQLRELVASVPLDGVFVDLRKPVTCFCEYCLNLCGHTTGDEMEEPGGAGANIPASDPRTPEAAESELRAAGILHDRAFRERAPLVREIAEIVRYARAGAGLFFPAGSIPGDVEYLAAGVELGAQQGRSGAGARPIRAGMAHRQGAEHIGRIRATHRRNDRFGSYRTQHSLDCDCYHLLRTGAKPLIETVLAPCCRLDPEIYRLVGSSYYGVMLQEKLCRGASPVKEAGVLAPFDGKGSTRTLRLVEDAGLPFEVIDARTEFEAYRLLILPDTIAVDADLSVKLDAYVRAGGALLASGWSGMNRNLSQFTLAPLGVIRVQQPVPAAGPRGAGELDRLSNTDYLIPGAGLAGGLARVPYAMYRRGLSIQANQGTEVLAELIPMPPQPDGPGSREYRRLPPGEPTAPAVVQNGRAIYFAHAIFGIYGDVAPPWVLRLFRNAVNRLLPDPVVRHDGPVSLHVSVTSQEPENRWIVHLVHYLSAPGIAEAQTVQDVIPIADTKISLKTPKPVTRIQCGPHDEDALPYWERDGRVEFVVRKLVGHAMIVVEFA